MSALMIFGIFTLLGAQLMLLTRIWVKQDSSGISGKTQELYAVIFLARNLDLFSSDYPLNLNEYILKIVFIGVSYSLVITIFFFHWGTYQSKHDTFRIELLIIPCLVLSFLANYGIELREIFWAFSVYLECVAIIPQLYMVSRLKRIENIVFRYIGLLAIYKIVHLMDIIHEQFYLGNYYIDQISLAAGTVQLLFYCDFFLTDLPSIVEDQQIDPQITKRGASDEEAGVSTNNSDKKRAEAEFGNSNVQGVVLSPAVLVVHNEKS